MKKRTKVPTRVPPRHFPERLGCRFMDGRVSEKWYFCQNSKLKPTWAPCLLRVIHAVGQFSGEIYEEGVVPASLEDPDVDRVWAWGSGFGAMEGGGLKIVASY